MQRKLLISPFLLCVVNVLVLQTKSSKLVVLQLQSTITRAGTENIALNVKLLNIVYYYVIIAHTQHRFIKLLMQLLIVIRTKANQLFRRFLKQIVYIFVR